MRYQGKITRWKDDQGFGFVTPNGGGEQVFVHIRAFARRGRRPVEGDIVTYIQSMDAKGRARAESVAYVMSGLPVAAERGDAVSGGLPMLAVLFFLFVAVCALAGKLPLAVLGLYAGASALAFAMYAWDKSAALRGQWRIRESTLHMIALFGGWPGALVAQRVLRHKSRKMSFQLTFWVTVLVNCGGLGWLFTAKGEAAFRPFLSVV